MARNYDTIAVFYDRLARLMYGKSLIAAQQFLVSSVPAGSRLLIVGGGTGWILEEITKIHASGLHITYIDASAKMIALAQQRYCGRNIVTFIAAPVQAVSIDVIYDVVLTPFFFDNFTDTTLQQVFSLIDNHIAAGGLWLYADFQDTDVRWQKMLLKMMYFFFRVSCGIEAGKLPHAGTCFANHHYQPVDRKTFINGFVASVIYQKE